jgi:hypothetical protein
MADPLVDVAVRVYAEFADRITLAEILVVVAAGATIWTPQSAAALPRWSSG